MIVNMTFSKVKDGRLNLSLLMMQCNLELKFLVTDEPTQMLRVPDQFVIPPIHVERNRLNGFNRLEYGHEQTHGAIIGTQEMEISLPLVFAIIQWSTIFLLTQLSHIEANLTGYIQSNALPFEIIQF